MIFRSIKLLYQRAEQENNEGDFESIKMRSLLSRYFKEIGQIEQTLEEFEKIQESNILDFIRSSFGADSESSRFTTYMENKGAKFLIRLKEKITEAFYKTKENLTSDGKSLNSIDKELFFEKFVENIIIVLKNNSDDLKTFIMEVIKKFKYTIPAYFNKDQITQFKKYLPIIFNKQQTSEISEELDSAPSESDF